MSGTPQGKVDDDDETVEVHSPVVFQCQTCRSIIGDSLAFIISCAKTRTLSLSYVTNIQRSSTTLTSSHGIDQGSTYQELLCSQCQCVLGKYYLATTTALDDCRDLYTIDTDVITSYTIGLETPEEERNYFGADQVTEYQKNVASIQKLLHNVETLKDIVYGFDEKMSKLQSEVELLRERGNDRDVVTSMMTRIYICLAIHGTNMICNFRMIDSHRNEAIAQHRQITAPQKWTSLDTVETPRTLVHNCLHHLLVKEDNHFNVII
jgi:hypothetical protein